jgi:hypothetical protein
MKHSLDFLFLLSGSLALFTPSIVFGGTPIQLKSLDQLTTTPQHYDGKRVRLDACLLVSRHGMALENCNWRPGQSSRLVNFEPSGKNDTAYQSLVKAGFASRYNDIVVATISGDFVFNPTQKPSFVLKISDVTNIRTIRDPEI